MKILDSGARGARMLTLLSGGLLLGCGSLSSLPPATMTPDAPALDPAGPNAPVEIERRRHRPTPTPAVTPTPAPSATPTRTPAPGATPTPVATPAPVITPAPTGGAPGRGFPVGAPWATTYGTAGQAGDLAKAASTFRIIDLDADPDMGNFTPAQITQLKANGQNRIISYLNLGSCETFRSYWSKVPSGFVSCQANTAAQLGAYQGYPDETWMDVGNAAYQNLIVNYVAPRLVAQGVDGFYLDNFEIVEHSNVSAATRQGGLDLVRMLRAKYPNLLFVMQNATSNVTRLGTTGGVSFASLLDGVAHEEVYKPTYDSQAESELLAWKAMGLMPGGRPFWIGTEDYTTNATAAQAAYTSSRSKGFSPYVSNSSGGQQTFYYWPF